MLAPLLLGETTRAFCERHGLSDRDFFALNPHKQAYLDDDGVSWTTYHDRGEVARINTETSATGEELLLSSDGQRYYTLEEQGQVDAKDSSSTGDDIAAGAAVGGFFLFWAAFTILPVVVVAYVIYRGTKYATRAVDEPR